MSQPGVTARIEPVKDGEGLWLFIDGGPEPADTSNLFKVARYAHLHESGGTMFPVMVEEIVAIRDSCNRWLANKGVNDEQLEAQLDDIFDTETIDCDRSHNPNGKPTGKHYSDFDLFLMKGKLKALVKQYQGAT